MKKVYIVTSGDYSDYHIKRVFSDRKMAEKYNKTISDPNEIEEYNIDNNLAQIKEEAFEWRDTLVLAGDKVVILRGWEEDEEDYYWRYEEIHNKVYLSSCCIGFIPLLGKLDIKEYKQLVYFFQMNGADI